MIGDEQYVSTESEFKWFVNEDIPDPREEAYEGLKEKGHEDPYQEYDLPDIDDFSLDTNDRDNEDIFDLYLGAEILLPEQDEDKKMAKVDSEVHHYQFLQKITDHKKDRSAIPISDGTIRSHNGNIVPKKTTRGWDLLAEWNYISSRWIPLKYLKVSNPIELAKYASRNRLDVKPAVKWWVRDAIIRRKSIIDKVKAKYWHTTHKFGMRVPKSVDEALAIDKETVNTLWFTAIQKEINNVRVAFEAWEEGSLEDSRRGQKLVGY